MVTRSAGKSHRVVFTKSALAEQAVPAARVLTDARIVSHVAFGELDLDANHVGGDMSWTPAVGDAGIESYETYLVIGAAGSWGMLAGGVAVGTNVCAGSSDADSTGKSHIVVYTKSSLAEPTTPAGSGVDGRFGERPCGFIRRSGLGCRRRHEGLPRHDSGLLHVSSLRSHPAHA